MPFVFLGVFCARGVSEPLDLIVVEVSPIACLQPRVAQRSDGDPLQVIDRMPDGIAHVSHLTVASFAQRDEERRARVVSLLRQERDLRGPHPAAVDDDSALQPFQIVRVGDAENLRFVDPGDAVARMRQLCREVAVVHQQ